MKRRTVTVTMINGDVWYVPEDTFVSIGVPETPTSVLQDFIRKSRGPLLLVTAQEDGGEQRYINANFILDINIAYEDVKPPSNVTNLNVAATGTAGEALITWSNPTSDFDHVRILRDGAEIVDNITDESYTDSGLTSGNTYEYTVITVDAAGNESSGVSESYTAA